MPTSGMEHTRELPRASRLILHSEMVRYPNLQVYKWSRKLYFHWQNWNFRYYRRPAEAYSIHEPVLLLTIASQALGFGGKSGCGKSPSSPAIPPRIYLARPFPEAIGRLNSRCIQSSRNNMRTESYLGMKRMTATSNWKSMMQITKHSSFYMFDVVFKGQRVGGCILYCKNRPSM